MNGTRARVQFSETWASDREFPSQPALSMERRLLELRQLAPLMPVALSRRKAARSGSAPPLIGRRYAT